MPSPEQALAEQFYRWELRGRGWAVWDRPVDLEPPFRPFISHWASGIPPVDDGRKSTLVSGLLNWLHRRWTRAPHTYPAPSSDWDEEIEPWTSREPEWVELRLALPEDLDVSKSVAEPFLLGLAGLRGTLAFEILGTPESILIQIACDKNVAETVEGQLTAYFPEAVISRHTGVLAEAWDHAGGGESVVAEFGLDREFMLPLASPASFSTDPLVGLVGALADVSRGEVALLQILFQPVRSPWAESLLRSVVCCDGTPFFCSPRDFVGEAKVKASRPLYAAMVRAAGRSGRSGRARELVARLSGALQPLADPQGNELIPLDNAGYDPVDHDDDVRARRSQRSGMILNSDELLALVHPPSSSVRSARLRQSLGRSKSAPASVLNHRLVLGANAHGGVVRQVTLSSDQRSKHLHALGVSGTGKSTFLLNLITQDLRNGDGVAVLDPHGDLIDAVLERVPPERVGDVVFIDPADEDYPVGFNILSAHSALEKNLLASDLVAVFRRLSTSWGDQMTSVLGNAILAFLESKRGGTLVDLRRFLVEPAFRKEFLTTVTDPEVVYYWSKEFALLKGRPQGPVLTRLDTFLRPKPIRYMVAQQHSRLDFAEIMDRGKILLARLSHGVIGEENSHLLGTLLVSKFHQLALARQQTKESERRHFWMYIDEFHNFATPSMAAVLSGARKYRLGLVLAHQEMHQLESKVPEVASAVISNAHTRVCFRLGDQDARKLESGFTSFEARDLQNLGVGEAVCRVERAEFDFNLRTPVIESVDTCFAAEVRHEAIRRSREKYATARCDVEAALERSREPDKELLIPAASTHVANRPNLVPSAVAVAPDVAPLSTTPTEPPPAAKKKRPRDVEEEVRPGRGGADHKYLQQLIQQWAQGMGYRAEIEGGVLGNRAADVALRKGDLSIGCEIGLTTEYLHELDNVRKCLAAGFSYVVAVSPDPKRLSKLKSVVAGKLEAAELERVRFFAPEELFAFIQELEVRQVTREKTVRGYKVKTTFRATDGAESKDRRDAVSQVVAQAMTRLRTRKGSK